MPKEHHLQKLHESYYSALSFIFFFEAIQNSLLLPVAPQLIQKLMVVGAQNDGSDFIEWKGQLCFYFGFYLFTFYGMQTLGMLFWSSRINTTNMKQCILAMIFIQSTSLLVISLNHSLTVTLIARSLQGFFAATLGIIKLTIDNYFQPGRDMQRVVDLSGIWYIGLALGVSLTSLLNYTNQHGLEYFQVFQQYPQLMVALINCVLQVICMIIVAIVMPEMGENRRSKQYKKMQSTMFFQSVFFSSQHDYTYTVTRHQRTRSTFELKLMKSILFSDRNLLFALLHSGLINFLYMAFFDMLPVYTYTVLNMGMDLQLSGLYCLAYFGLFISTLFFLPSFFPSYQQSFVWSHLLGLASFAILYLLRFAPNMPLVACGWIIFAVSANQLFTQANASIDNICLSYTEDADHVRNLTQLINALARGFGSLGLALAAAFNFWHYNDFYYDFLQVFIIAMVIIFMAAMLSACIDGDENQKRESGASRLYNQELGLSKSEIYA